MRISYSWVYSSYSSSISHSEQKKHPHRVASQFKRTFKALSNYTHAHEVEYAGRKPPNGGERRAGRRSSRVTSHTNRDERRGFFRREEYSAGAKRGSGTFSLFFPNVSIWSSSSLSNDVDDDESVCASSARKRDKSLLSYNETTLSSRASSSLSFALGKRRVFSSRDLIFLIFHSRTRLSRCVVLWMRVTQRDDHERQRDDKDNAKSIRPREEIDSFYLLTTVLYSFYPTTTTESV